MLNYFKNEFRRAFISKSTFIAMFIVSISILIPYYDDLKVPFPGSDGINFFIRASAYLHLSYLPFLATIIACIPFSISYILDKESKMFIYIYTKLNVKKYMTIRLLVNAIVSGLVFVIPEILILAFLTLVHGINKNPIEIVGALSSIYYSNKVMYSLILILVSFIFGAVISTFALGISAMVKNKYLTLFIPFGYMIVSGTIFEIFGINEIINLNIVTLIDLGYSTKTTGINVLLYAVALFLIGTFLFFYFGKKNSYE